jgi:D-alanine-D-alanine ligase
MSDKAKDMAERTGLRIRRSARAPTAPSDLSGYAPHRPAPHNDGSFYVLEANPNPQLAYGEDFAESAEVVGIGYPELLQRILNLGLRYRPDRRG